MDAPAAIVLRRDEHGTVFVAEPVPSVAVVPLELLTSVLVREWVVLSALGDGAQDQRVNVCGWVFIVIGWDARNLGLILARDADASPPTVAAPWPAE